MRVTQNITSQPKQQKQEIKQNTPHKTSFKGGFDSVVIGAMDAIERGGLFASFTVQDMLGTNLPRPIAGLTRNKKENKGQVNKTFALKEAIREFTTGPSMFLIPAGILSLAKKHIGKATAVPAETLKGLGDIFKNTVNETNIADAKKLKADYYTNAFKNILKESTNLNEKEIAEKASEITEDFIDLASKKKKPFWDNIKGKQVEGSLEDGITNLSNKISNLIKQTSNDASTDFTVAKFKNANGDVIAKPIKKMFEHITDYADDAIKNTTKAVANKDAKTFLKTASEYLEKFNLKRVNQRFALNLTMMVGVLSFLTIIPNLYNISKDNPALRGLEPETQPTEAKKGEAVNASK